MNLEKNIVLAMETAIGGGSLSIYANGSEIDSWVGEKEISKAEDVLEQIVILFERNRIEKTDLRLIKVSKGPGSSTGAKIGLAIAKGLSNSLNIKITEVSVLEAIYRESANNAENVVVVLPAGKMAVYVQSFQNLSSNQTAEMRMALDKFENYLTDTKIDQIIFYEKAFEICQSIIDKKENLKNTSRMITTNLATLVGKD